MSAGLLLNKHTCSSISTRDSESVRWQAPAPPMPPPIICWRTDHPSCIADVPTPVLPVGSPTPCLPAIILIEDAPPTASVHSSIVTLVNSAIGAGILALPYAFRCTGWAAGLATVFSLGATQAYTLFVLSRHAEEAGSTTYGALVRLIDRLHLSTMMCAAAAASCCFMAV